MKTLLITLAELIALVRNNADVATKLATHFGDDFTTKAGRPNTNKILGALPATDEEANELALQLGIVVEKKQDPVSTPKVRPMIGLYPVIALNIYPKVQERETSTGAIRHVSGNIMLDRLYPELGTQVVELTSIQLALIYNNAGIERTQMVIDDNSVNLSDEHYDKLLILKDMLTGSGTKAIVSSQKHTTDDTYEDEHGNQLHYTQNWTRVSCSGVQIPLSAKIEFMKYKSAVQELAVLTANANRAEQLALNSLR